MKLDTDREEERRNEWEGKRGRMRKVREMGKGRKRRMKRGEEDKVEGDKGEKKK